MYLITAMVLRKISQSVTRVDIYSMTVLGEHQPKLYVLVCFNYESEGKTSLFLAQIKYALKVKFI